MTEATRRPKRHLSPDDIRFIRHTFSMKQQELADYMGVEKNTVTRWEMGLHKPVGQRRRKLMRLVKRAQKYAEAKANGVQGVSEAAALQPSGGGDGED